MKKTPEHGGSCPICGKPRDPQVRPFCSRRCRDRDFLAWADGRYAVPVAPDPDEEPVEVAPRYPDRPDDE